MIGLVIIFIIFIVLLVTLLLVDVNSDFFGEHVAKPFESAAFFIGNPGLGNRLSSYFYYVVRAFRLNKSFHIMPDMIEKTPANSIIQFLPKVLEVDRTIRRNLLELKPKTVFFNFWQIKKFYRKQTEEMSIMSPLISKCVKHAFNEMNKQALIPNVKYFDENTVVIHLRCGDIPFIRDKLYNLSRYHFFIDAIEHCRKQVNVDITKLVIVHGARPRNKTENIVACEGYVKNMTQYIMEICGINEFERVSCSESEDFFTLCNASNLIIGGHSSFAMLAGVANEFGNVYANTSCYADFNHSSQIHPRWHWIESNILEHSRVENYYDVDKVSCLLQE